MKCTFDSLGRADFSNGMGTTIFYVLDRPGQSGGDTLYLSTTAAYEHLSEDFRKRLDGLYAVHSGLSQAAVADKRGRYIREPIETVHPVIRTHPVPPRPTHLTIGIEDKIVIRKPSLHPSNRRLQR